MIKKLKNKVIKYLMEKDIRNGKFEEYKNSGIKVCIRTDLGNGKTNWNLKTSIYKAITEYFIYSEEQLKDKGIYKIPEIDNPPKIKKDGDKEIIELKDLDFSKGYDYMYQNYFWNNYYNIRQEYNNEVEALFNSILSTLVTIAINIIANLIG